MRRSRLIERSGGGPGFWSTPTGPRSAHAVLENRPGAIDCAAGTMPDLAGHAFDRWSGRQDSNLRPSAPKADALPGCATPRLAQALRFPAIFAQAQRWLRGRTRQNKAGTGSKSPEIVPNLSGTSRACAGHRHGICEEPPHPKLWITREIKTAGRAATLRSGSLHSCAAILYLYLNLAASASHLSRMPLL